MSWSSTAWHQHNSSWRLREHGGVEFDVTEVDRLLTTTRSVRRRLDRDRPVDPKLIDECLEVALQAPTGSGFEDWRWIVVTDPHVRAKIGEVYRDWTTRYNEWWRSSDPDFDEASPAVVSAQVLAEHLSDVPVLVVPCFMRRGWHETNPARDFVHTSVYGSIFPAVWSFQLACRARGLGTCLITGHLNYEDRMSEILGLPADVGQAGLVAVAHADGDFRPATRTPLADLVHRDRWGSGCSDPDDS